jgi:uncharacterized protein (TIGR02145 family)
MNFFAKQTSFLPLLGLALVACCMVTACGEDESATTSTGILGMTGSLAANMHDYAIRDTTIFLKAEGITAPAKDKITYQWSITDPLSLYVWGPVVKYKFPRDTENSVTIKLSGTADGYYSSAVSKTITLIGKTFAETVDLPASASTFTEFTDPRDGKTYRYAHIGNYDWMTQNLNWAGVAGAVAGKSYKNQPEYDIIFGRLYSWEEASSTLTPICPAGWRLPDTTAWSELGQALNGGVAVPFESYWQDLGSRAAADATINGTKIWPYDPNNKKENSVGWNALPAGEYSGGIFTGNGRYGHWWSATPYPNTTDQAYARYIIYNNAAFYFVNRHKQSYLSVRCVRPVQP